MEKYKRRKCGDSDEVYYSRLKRLEFEEDWDIKEKMTIANGFWRETIYLWKKVKPMSVTCVVLGMPRNQSATHAEVHNKTPKHVARASNWHVDDCSQCGINPCIINTSSSNHAANLLSHAQAVQQLTIQLYQSSDNVGVYGTLCKV